MKSLAAWSSAYFRDRWRMLSVPAWGVSLLTHILLFLLLSLFVYEPERAPARVELDVALSKLPEVPELDQIELDLQPFELIEPFENPTDVPDSPAMSQLSPLSDLPEPAPISPVDMPALDKASEILDGPLAGSSAAKGSGSSFDARGMGLRKAMLGSQGGTRQTEQAVIDGLNWLARHQFPDGHWSLHEHVCHRCLGMGSMRADMAATAFGLLPFLAAGQTHMTKNPHKEVVERGLKWIIANQEATTGSLARGASSNAPMYAHGLATIALAEAYALSRDRTVGIAAQKAIDYIQQAQDPVGGGWRYVPQQPGDTSVVGWQLMALKSAQMGGLEVRPQTLLLAQKFLDSVSSGEHKGLFGYTDATSPTVRLTAIGILCLQYLGARRDDPRIQEGIDFLMKTPASANSRDSYYWYYASQVMHNIQGPDWDWWNRTMRTVWIDSQIRDEQSCAFGSWDPNLPFPDSFREQGGRMMTTSIGLLTLEIYYRYLPLYKFSVEEDGLTKAGSN